jgi:ethanolamine utilization protein EutN
LSIIGVAWYLLPAMYLGRVIGTVVAERKAEGLSGRTFLLVQPVDDQQAPVGPMQVAVDTVKAGPKDLVVLVGSREASLALDPTFVPVDAAIVGIVDDLNLSAVPARKAASR